MIQDISELLYSAASGVVDTYPVVADVENYAELPLPYAVYRLTKEPRRTKERRRNAWDVEFLLVAQTSSGCRALLDRLESSLEGLSPAVSVLSGNSSVEFDDDDRVYIGKIQFKIEEL